MVGKNGQDLILELLTQKTGTHFSQYKKNTIKRRINKRMESLGIDHMEDYYFYIRRTPKELDDLFETLLIGVTEFFRDKSVFEALEKVLINKEMNKSKTYRIWSVGCATGEESYSLAIMVLELMENELPQYDLQIFATDVHERALKIARNGIYSADQLKNIPGRLIKKYFEKIPEGFEVKRKVKQNVLFTKHDVTSDPPFIRLDLIVYRNLMIYFNTELQRQVLKLFNYALNPDGLLLMGKSENVNDPQYFENMDPLNKIFLKSESEPMHGHLHSQPFHKRENVSTSYLGSEKKEISLKDIVKETLLNTFEHPFLIVDEQNKIREIYGSVRLFLELKDGGMNADITKMVNPELQLDLRALLVKVKKKQQMVKSRVIRFRVFDQEYKVILMIKPLLYLYGKNSYYMVIFELSDDIPVDEKKVNDPQDFEIATRRIQELEEELAISRDQLQIFTEELEASNEELQAMNEELQSGNEELKSSNEELETSNEELLSSNEELSSTNNELRKINKNILEKDDELKNLYEKLEESESRFRYLADHAPVMIWVTGQDEMGNYFNEKWLEFTGMDLGKMSREERFDLIHPDDRDQTRQAFQAAEKEKRQFSYEYIEDFKCMLSERKIKIVGKTKSRIEGDKHRLEQVISNLLSNAVKFSPDDKEIEVRLKRNKQSVRLEVKDHGVGIPEEHAGNIFKRFFQIGQGNYKSGMGVGLYICKEIIERHHGHIEVVSEVGMGSSFIVTVPALE